MSCRHSHRFVTRKSSHLSAHNSFSSSSSSCKRFICDFFLTAVLLNMDPSQIFAKKSAPPPPADSPEPEDSSDRERPPPPDLDVQESGENIFSSGSRDEVDDFLMEIGDPYESSLSHCDKSPSTDTPPLQPQRQNNPPLASRSSSAPAASADSSRHQQENRTTESDMENGGKDAETPNNTLMENSDSSAPPNVDELLASLEATVQGKQPAVDGKENIPNPPLPSTPTPREPPPPPPPNPEVLGSLTDGKKKRKPRNTRQQKKNAAAAKNVGSQRTEGSGARAKPLKGKAAGKSNSGQQSTLDNKASGSSKGAAAAFPSGNRTWTAPHLLGPSSSSSSPPAPGQSFLSSTPNNAYNTPRPKPLTEACKDITSYKFLPEDDERVEIVLWRSYAKTSRDQRRSNQHTTTRFLRCPMLMRRTF